MSESPKMPETGKCFDHLGGKSAPLIIKRLIKQKWIVPEQDKKTIFEVPEKGQQKLKEVFDTDIADLDD
jgi:hypothetical protein